MISFSSIENLASDFACPIEGGRELSLLIAMSSEVSVEILNTPGEMDVSLFSYTARVASDLSVVMLSGMSLSRF